MVSREPRRIRVIYAPLKKLNRRRRSNKRYLAKLIRSQLRAHAQNIVLADREHSDMTEKLRDDRVCGLKTALVRAG